jgi:hypothetical protein
MTEKPPIDYGVRTQGLCGAGSATSGSTQCRFGTDKAFRGYLYPPLPSTLLADTRSSALPTAICCLKPMRSCEYLHNTSQQMIHQDTGANARSEGAELATHGVYNCEGPASDVVVSVTQENKQDAARSGTTIAEEEPLELPYSVLSERVKVTVILTASFTAIISPISGSIYFPALNSIAADLGVSISLITLTVTTYLVGSLAI